MTMRDETVTERPSQDVESLYRDEGARLWRAVFFYAGDRDVADDAIAEAFAQLLRRGEDVGDPAAWVWRSAFALAGRDLKRRRTTAPSMEAAPADPQVPSELAEALGGLTRRQRACVVLHYYAGYSQVEVAKLMGTSSSTVGVHLHRARKRLRSLLEDEDED